jgi:hypothetical protein
MVIATESKPSLVPERGLERINRRRALANTMTITLRLP